MYVPTAFHFTVGISLVGFQCFQLVFSIDWIPNQYGKHILDDGQLTSFFLYVVSCYVKRKGKCEMWTVLYHLAFYGRTPQGLKFINFDFSPFSTYTSSVLRQIIIFFSFMVSNFQRSARFLSLFFSPASSSICARFFGNRKYSGIQSLHPREVFLIFFFQKKKISFFVVGFSSSMKSWINQDFIRRKKNQRN